MNEPLKAPLHSPPPDLASYQKPNPPESKTPETDAFAATPRGLGTGYYQALEYARSLEIQRDEALAKLAEATQDVRRMNLAENLIHGAVELRLGYDNIPTVSLGKPVYETPPLRYQLDMVDAAMKGDR